VALNKPLPSSSVGTEAKEPEPDGEVPDIEHEATVDQSDTEIFEDIESTEDEAESVISADETATPGIVEEAEAVDAGTALDALPEEPEPAPDYVFSAVKGADGVVSFRGSIPAAFLQEIIALEGMDFQISEIRTRSDAPDGFAGAARAGL